MHLARLPVVAALGAALALPASADGQVWIVDDVPGPGVGFTTIQEAVDAASDGDAIVVREGESYYPAFTITAKDLTVVAAPGEDPLVSSNPSIEVRQLARHQTVVIQRLRVNGIVSVSNAGTVWLEGLSQEVGASLVSAHDSTCVVVLRCYLAGSSAFDDGIYSDGSSLVVMNSTLYVGYISAAGLNPSGIVLENGSFGYLARKPALGATAFPPCSAPGGVGLVVGSDSAADLLNSGFAGGVGCGSEPNGPSVVGSPTYLMGQAKFVTVSSPVEETNVSHVSFFGRLGDTATLVRADGPAYDYDPGLLAPRLVDTGSIVAMETLGTLESSP